jgi:hypothetical protein
MEKGGWSLGGVQHVSSARWAWAWDEIGTGGPSVLHNPRGSCEAGNCRPSSSGTRHETPAATPTVRHTAFPGGPSGTDDTQPFSPVLSNLSRKGVLDIVVAGSRGRSERRVRPRSSRRLSPGHESSSIVIGEGPLLRSHEWAGSEI